MIAFEERHCEADDGIVDPEFCLEYQIQKFLVYEAHIEECLNPDFGTDKYLEQSAVWKKQKIWEKVIEDETSMPFISGEDIFEFGFVFCFAQILFQQNDTCQKYNR